jgi:energy-coupling factor transporter ATP-binding protein EcfA2
MSTKIKNIIIKGFRGVKSTIELPLTSKSILIYGDNGSGKSSISDSIEWFYSDRVTHLSSNEIDLKDALRNSSLNDTEVSEVKISFSNSAYDCSKTLSYKRNKLSVESSNTSTDFNKYISKTVNENILLRYQSLTDFVDNTKGEKLKYLSDIIGFSEVTRKKEVLQRSYNSIKAEIKNQNFEAQINTQKRVLIEKIGAAISQEQNLFEKMNEKIQPLKIGIEIKSIKDIDKVLEHIKKPVNNKLITELRFLENANSILNNLKSEIDFINNEYVKYYQEFDKIANDVQSIMQTFLAELLRTGDAVLERKYHNDPTCPLCLQPKNIDDLRAEIATRLKEIDESSKQKASFDKAKQMIANISTERLKRLEIILSENLVEEEGNNAVKAGFNSLRNKITLYQKASNIKVMSGDKLPNSDDFKLTFNDFEFQNQIEERIKQIQAILKKDNSAVLYSNISASKDAFIKIKYFENQKVKFENQRKSLEIIYNEFIKKQKEGLESFISTFSGKIDEFYQYMNPGEPFQEIKIETIGEEDGLNGITIKYKYNGKWVSPPQKYFSESHLNCFGLSFFLASVEAFNETNSFIILDDVISSFDSTHRKRFADLLFEKFSKYQLILLTHEREWFSNVVSPLAKRKGWLINEIFWDNDKGTYIDEKSKDLKEFIEANLISGQTDNLGNPIRRYLEHSLKDICYHLDVKVSFQFNATNEKRMPDELLNELKSRINNKSKELQAKIPTIERVSNSSLFGNLLSHDNPFNPKIGDLKAFWEDIKELEKVFICQQPGCKKTKVSIYNYDTVAKKIRCGCDFTKYDWKK